LTFTQARKKTSTWQSNASPIWLGAAVTRRLDWRRRRATNAELQPARTS
jgi:hypothetical protein